MVYLLSVYYSLVVFTDCGCKVAYIYINKWIYVNECQVYKENKNKIHDITPVITEF